MAKRITKTYSELIRLSTFEERFNYLKIGQGVGEETFGFERYLNQVFYTSPEWRKFRRDIIIRDNGCDLGIPDREIGKFITIHHINEIAELQKELIKAKTESIHSEKHREELFTKAIEAMKMYSGSGDPNGEKNY